MRKKLLLILCLLLVTGCTFGADENLENSTSEEEETHEELPPVPVYVDENPVTVGLYQNGKLVKSVTAPVQASVDIASFDVYFTNEENVGGTNTKRNFNKYAANYENVNAYKIGFMISFSIDGEEITKTITGPKDTYIFGPYIYCYLYDDVHQPDGSWYSHVKENDVNDDTIYSSIKLYAVDDASKITSPITLTVFTYDTEDDFDEFGIYRGNSKYAITINKK